MEDRKQFMSGSFFQSLRFRLIALTLSIEIIMLSLLIGNSLRLVDQQVKQQLITERSNLNQLFLNSININLFERDYVTMESTLHNIIETKMVTNPILHIDVMDNEEQIFLEIGSHIEKLQDIQNDIAYIDYNKPYLMHTSAIELGGVKIGNIRYIISIQQTIRFRSTLLQQAVTIATLEILLSLLLLFLLGFWLTRDLDKLVSATKQIAKGNFHIDLKLKSKGEIGLLADSLRFMSKEIRQSHQAQQGLLENSQQEQARLRSLLTSMSIGILYENLQHEVDYYNPAFIRVWTIDESKIFTGMKTEEVLRYSSNVISHPDHFSKHILDVESTHENSESFEILTADGRTIHQLSYPVMDETRRFIGRIWLYEDVTRQKQTAEQLLYLAERDHLTGLYNRRRFQEELEQKIRIYNRNEQMFALLFFDLDEFKLINDTFGHRAGDSVLIRISGELSTLIRSDVFLSRLGGDEFGLLSPIKSDANAKTLADRIVQSISSLSFRFEGNNLRITTSIGIAIFPQHGNNLEELVAKADTAMYAAKQRGKNTSRLFEESMLNSSSMTQHLTWNERIIDALDNNKFVLHYQAVKNIQRDEISHYELLIRMIDDKHPDKLIMPGNFIPVAEKSGKIMKIDQWVVNQAITLLAQHQDIPSLAVNVSGRSLDEPTLAHNIASLLEEKQVDARRLIIELTETAAVSDLADAQRFIEQMHRTGCKVYLDDFGAGFSTFSYLKHIDADCLKFDGQFIVNLSNDHENQIFVKSMVSIAKGLGKNTVAEFVEDADTLALLKEFGVDMAQGYYIHKPAAEMI